MAEQTRAGTFASTQAGTQSGASSTNSETLVGRVRDRATEQLNTQKNRATDGLGSVAHAVRGTTDRLRQENHDTVARYVEQAADQIERFSSRLKDKDVTELMHDAQRLARRQPALFVGGAFAVGLIGARFLKSSSPYETSHERNYGGSKYGGSYEGSDYRRPSSTSGTAANAYGNRVPASAGAASTASTGTGTATGSRGRSGSSSRGSDYKPTEEM
jgi:hypothetical protein